MLTLGAAAHTDEAWLTRPLLNSCCVARFLTGHRPVRGHGAGLEDPLL